jgi:lantibiotic modifying enzyme
MELRTLQISNVDDYNGVTNFGQTPSKTPRAGLLINGVIRALAFLNDATFAYRVSVDVETLAPRIRAEIKDGFNGVCWDDGMLGVLVAVLGWQPLYTDVKVRTYVGSWIAGKGLDFAKTLDVYVRTPKIELGPPFVPPACQKVWYWLWITKA